MASNVERRKAEIIESGSTIRHYLLNQRSLRGEREGIKRFSPPRKEDRAKSRHERILEKMDQERTQRIWERTSSALQSPNFTLKDIQVELRYLVRRGFIQMISLSPCNEEKLHL